MNRMQDKEHKTGRPRQAAQSTTGGFLLPEYPNAFIGRVHHLKSISMLLRKPAVRLLTLLGPGGIGKTRLAVRMGQFLQPDFQHGVCFVPLDAVTDTGQVPLYIGRQLGLQERRGDDWVDRICEYLTDRHLLLVLDNLEQIPGCIAVIDRILKTCPQVKILATSRQILDHVLEVEYPLDSLNRPNSQLFPVPHDLLKFEAVGLFVQRARTTRPGFEVHEKNAPAIAGICEELEGLPLAIELAAARVKLLSPELILQYLRGKIDLLKTTSKTTRPRHQTIRNTIKWSYDLLDEREREMFQRLALFKSGFTPAALQSICPGSDPLELIESFINKSLVVKAGESGQFPRFRMLKLIRDFGREQLAANPDQEIYHRSFVRYFVNLLEQGPSAVLCPDESAWLTFLEAEYENLTFTLDWLMVHEPEEATRLGASFWRFHQNRGLLREGRQMIRQLLPLSTGQPLVRAKLLEGAGVLAQNLGQYGEAKDYFRECLQLWEDSGKRTEIIKALNNIGWAEWRIGHYDETLRHAEKALSLSIAANDYRGRTKSLNNMAWIFFCRGLYEEAEDKQRKVLQIQRNHEDLRGIAFARTNLSRALLRTGKFDEAKTLITEAIGHFTKLKDRQLLSFSKLVLSEYHTETGNSAAASTLLRQQCLPGFMEIGDVWGIANCHRHLGTICLKEQDFAEARDCLGKALEAFRSSCDKRGEAATTYCLSLLGSALDDDATARRNLDRSRQLAAELGARDLMSKGWQRLAQGAEQEQHYRKVLLYLGIADYFAEQSGQYRHRNFQREVQQQLQMLTQNLEPGLQIPALVRQLYPGGKSDHQSGLCSEEDLANRIVALLAAAWPEGVPTAEDRFVTRVRNIILDNLHDREFGVRELCSAVGISRSQLHRRLSAKTGYPVSGLIRRVRLEKAKELLLDPQRTVAAVAYDTGFRDPDYFHRVFKQTFQMTPGEFRRSTPPI